MISFIVFPLYIKHLNQLLLSEIISTAKYEALYHRAILLLNELDEIKTTFKRHNGDQLKTIEKDHQAAK